MLFIPAGRLIVSSELQLLKTFWFNVARVDGSAIAVNAVQSLKTEAPNVVMPSPIVTVVIPAQPINAFVAIVLTLYVTPSYSTCEGIEISPVVEISMAGSVLLPTFTSISSTSVIV